METDDELMAKYRANYQTRTGSEGPCYENCKKELFCDLRTTSYNQYQECVEHP